MTNIAAHQNGDIWDESTEADFILDLRDDSLHLNAEGFAKCWGRLTRKEKFQIKKTCVFVREAGANDLCKLCTRGLKRARQDPLDPAEFELPEFDDF